MDVAGARVQATVSLGIASTESFGYDLDTLMRRADTAVYAAKQQGRNRVVAATADDARQLGASQARRDRLSRGCCDRSNPNAGAMIF